MNFPLFFYCDRSYVRVGSQVAPAAKVFEEIEEDEWKFFTRFKDNNSGLI
ncbi:MAG: hypothetical protein O3C43_02005 [Verrucomicrobia bacterium]|nr:hypothetical protein [Verrucomicrobiota bacterium]MDA1065256.1 hypothetical protein [Verrucomicrobiota bacterium]